MLTADARQRWVGLGGAATGLAAFTRRGGGRGLGRQPGIPFRAGPRCVGPCSPTSRPWRRQSPVIDDFDRIALLDPPYLAASVAELARLDLPVHLLAGPVEFEFTARVAAYHPSTRTGNSGTSSATFAKLTQSTVRRPREPLRGVPLRRRQLNPFAGAGAAALLRILVETGLARTEAGGGPKGHILGEGGSFPFRSFSHIIQASSGLQAISQPVRQADRDAVTPGGDAAGRSGRARGTVPKRSRHWLLRPTRRRELPI